MKKHFYKVLGISYAVLLTSSLHAFNPELNRDLEKITGPGDDSTVVVPVRPDTFQHHGPIKPHHLLHPKLHLHDSLHTTHPKKDSILHPNPPVPDTVKHPKPPVHDSLNHPHPKKDTIHPKPPVPDSLKHPKPHVHDSLNPGHPKKDTIHPKPPVPDTLKHPKPHVNDSLKTTIRLKVSIAPMPVAMGEGKITIHGIKPGDHILVVIYTSQGTLVINQELNKKDISLADLKAGYYLYKISDQSGNLVSGSFFIE